MHRWEDLCWAHGPRRGRGTGDSVWIFARPPIGPTPKGPQRAAPRSPRPSPSRRSRSGPTPLLTVRRSDEVKPVSHLEQ